MKADTSKKPVAMIRPARKDDEIRKRAFELFEARGKGDGQDLDDWLRAEDEITRAA